MILSLMPLHRQVLNAGERLHLEGPALAAALSDIEARQSLLESVTSMLLLPVKMNGECRGVVSAASLNPARPIRMNRQIQLLTDAAAGILGTALARPVVKPVESLIESTRAVDRMARRLDPAVEAESPVPF
jgi:hypothetical protein